MEWKVLYVGSAHDGSKDQVLDEILVGPVPVGVNKFVLQADAPDPAALPPDDILGVTVVLVTCSYQEREFIRVGYYVNNEYHCPEYLQKVQAAAEAAAKAAQQQQPVAAEGGSGGEDPAANAPAVEPPAPPSYPALDMTKVQRQILADKPRVTKFPIPWSKQQEEEQKRLQEDHGALQMSMNNEDSNSNMMTMMQNSSYDEEDEDDGDDPAMIDKLSTPDTAAASASDAEMEIDLE